MIFYLFSSAAPADEGAEVSLEATCAGRYIWRGMPINEEPVIQPSMDISDSGFSLNVWGSIDTTDWGEREGGYEDQTGNLAEIDSTASYGNSLGPVSFSVGFITYTFPNIQLDSTLEAFAGLSLDVPLSPSVTSYWDEGLARGANYLSFDVGHSFSLWESAEISIGLDLFAAAAYANKEFNEAYYGLEDDDWHDWSVGASLPVSLKYGFSLTPGFFHSSIIDGDIREVIEDGWELSPDNDVLTLSLGWSFPL